MRCWGAVGYGICCGVAGVFTQRLGLYAGFVASMLIHLLSLAPGSQIPIGARKGVSRWAGSTLCCCLSPPTCRLLCAGATACPDAYCAGHWHGWMPWAVSWWLAARLTLGASSIGATKGVSRWAHCTLCCLGGVGLA